MILLGTIISLLIWLGTIITDLYVAPRKIYIKTGLTSFQFSSVPWPIGSSGGHERWFSRDPLLVFSAGYPCEQLWHGQGCPLFDAVLHFLCQPQHPPPSKVPWKMGSERLLCHVTCLNHASFCLLTVARRGSCGLSCNSHANVNQFTFPILLWACNKRLTPPPPKWPLAANFISWILNTFPSIGDSQIYHHTLSLAVDKKKEGLCSTIL